MIKYIKSLFKKHNSVDLDKLILKIKTEAYDQGYKAGANQNKNKPCVCGFWGKNK